MTWREWSVLGVVLGTVIVPVFSQPPFGGPPGFPGGPPGFPGGPGGVMGLGGVDLDPLVGLNDTRKPLRSKLLQVPSIQRKYLARVREIAEKSLDWKNLGPVVAQYRDLIRAEVELDPKKLDSFAAFERVTADQPELSRPGREYPLRTFADQRRKYLLEWKPKP